MQCAFHAIGPRAIEQVLAAYERVLAARPRRDHRHRIEHFLVPRPDQIERAAALGLGLGVQPTFHDYWGRPGGMYAARLGPERAGTVSPLATLRRAGLVLGGGSDSDVTPLDPLLGVRAAVTHPVASERLDVAAALDMWVSGSRWLGFESDSGRLSPGQRADLVLLGRDPLATPAGELDRIPVLATWVAGRKIVTSAPPRA
jgi:predicted amidohydrolase YtcJ